MLFWQTANHWCSLLQHPISCHRECYAMPQVWEAVAVGTHTAVNQTQATEVPAAMVAALPEGKKARWPSLSVLETKDQPGVD